MSLKSHFLRVLRGNETRRIQFSFQGVGGSTVTVNSQNFTKVAAAIDGGKIAFDEGQTGSYSAYYDRTGPLFKVNPVVYKGSRQFDALLVHESVHASFHLMNLKVPAFDNETAGYLAQGFYLRNSGFRRDDAMNDMEFFGKRSIQNGSGLIDETMLAELRKALFAHPAYEKKRLLFLLNAFGYNP